MALAASPGVRIEAPALRRPRLRRAIAGPTRPGSLVGLLLLGLLAILWSLFAWLAFADRREALDHAQRELTSLSQAYAEYAAMLATSDSAGGETARRLDPMRDRERLAAFRSALAPPLGTELRLWRIADGVLLAGDPAGRLEPVPFAGARLEGSDGIARAPDRLTEVAERPRAGVVAVAERSTQAVLEDWGTDTLAAAGGLGALSLTVALLGGLLVRQLDRRAASDARWRALVEHTTDGVYLIRIEPANDPADPALLRFRYEMVNPAGIAFWSARRDPGDLIGRDVRDVLPPETSRQVVAEYHAAVATGAPRRYEVVSRNGEIVREAIAVPVRDAAHGPVTHLVVTTRDVTEQKQRRQTLDQALRRAEAASRAKSEFLANTGHELRTPLNAVIGYADLLASGIAGPLAAKQADYIDIIHGSGRHLLEIINDILDLATAETGRIDLREEAVAPRAVVERCASLMTRRIETGGLTLAVDHAGAPAEICADPMRLKQILLNLLSNAVKFTPRGGLIGLTARRTGGGGVAFTVSDSGPGMTEDEITRALETFGQVDGGLARRHQGTGLGLTLARRLTERHGRHARDRQREGSRHDRHGHLAGGTGRERAYSSSVLISASSWDGR
ncbi:MAG: ATP-binding protein [Pseudomonadota bacterium]